MMELQIIFPYNQFGDALNKLVIAMVFDYGNQKDYLMKVLNILLHLILYFL